ncbi:hypothetical protein CAOG_08544 [Capsaspora owczarzaki ATCC 30864]|uniref:Selenoprotein K n=1 Tax=Capsaspora owczarzaki (strain ATCC 30864) TaxID=595528 RepID=A0A0D2U5M2_CAPO3|nr:hypothetical protein CAOG_08544 [Capsaspora owczarzaki ATCC 30864]KJE90451.1 hypothetical protein CAOG_008544 [Capsaspora owczarzaki ATCC 30864]|eukprot:XP_011270126.1 hypothetical protein CAOG_08544 [Capsaspora owczarzaki ATCC 30864]
MPYISASGQVEQRRSPLKAIVAFLWAILDFFVTFFKTMFQPTKGHSMSSVGQERRKFDGRGGGNPGDDRRIGRLGGSSSMNVPCAPGG